MIKRLSLTNFKCFRSQEFHLRQLNVLCGLNGTGKSTVVQSLLIAQEASEIPVGGSQCIPLNGPFGMELGTVGDVLCQSAPEHIINITLEAEGGTSSVIGRADDAQLDDHFLQATVEGAAVPDPLQIKTGFHFTYLSAERNGPRTTQPIQSRPAQRMSLGAKGEYSAEVLARFEWDEVRPQLRHTSTGEDNKLLRQQVELWMSEWSPGLQVTADLITGSNIARVQFQRRDVSSEWMRPTNVGFGLSHSLPIVLAGLLAPVGGLLIVDNPESHLHPRGQSAIGAFLSVVAASGVQVVIETHSDHVLNGIRIAAKRGHIDAQQVSIHYFDRSDLNGDTSVVNPQLTQDGKLTEWPPGFFDEWESALHELL